MLKCPNCQADVTNETSTRCPSCAEDIGFPNVRDVDTEDERSALDARYQVAHVEAASRGAVPTVNAFEARVRDESGAVIDMGWAFFRQLVLHGALYATYYNTVRSGVRSPAAPEDDRRRRVADAWLLRGYADEIRFAALSLDGRGLTSYGGEVQAKLRDVAIRKRATVLEANSFALAADFDVWEAPPLGYRSIWSERHRLAVAKLGVRLDTTTDPAAFADILLFSEGDRATDAYMEVLIHGSLTVESLDSVHIGYVPVSGPDKVDHRRVLKALAAHDVTVRSA